MCQNVVVRIGDASPARAQLGCCGRLAECSASLKSRHVVLSDMSLNTNCIEGSFHDDLRIAAVPYQ
jgi:hypothetical protein